MVGKFEKPTQTFEKPTKSFRNPPKSINKDSKSFENPTKIPLLFVKVGAWKKLWPETKYVSEDKDSFMKSSQQKLRRIITCEFRWFWDRNVSKFEIFSV